MAGQAIRTHGMTALLVAMATESRIRESIDSTLASGSASIGTRHCS